MTSTLLKKPRPGQPLLGAIDQHRIERVAFSQAELAADDVILRALVAADVDALDVNSRTFVDGVDDANRARRRIGSRSRADAREGEALLGGGQRQLLDRLVDVGSVVDVALLGQDLSVQALAIEALQRVLDCDGAEVVALAFFDREVDEEAGAVCDRARHCAATTVASA